MRGALNSCPGERVSDHSHPPRSEHTSRSQAKLYFPAGEGLNHYIGSPKMARGQETSPRRFLCGGRSHISDSGGVHPISSWLFWGPSGDSSVSQCPGDGAPPALRPSPAHPPSLLSSGLPKHCCNTFSKQANDVKGRRTQEKTSWLRMYADTVNLTKNQQ